MDGVTIAFSVLAALASFAIAAVVVGREARRLDSVAPRAVYDLDQARKAHPAVHSRHFGLLGQPIVSQYRGFCVPG